LAGPGFPGPPRHYHRELTDMFYVLEGTLTFVVGDDTVEAPPGTFLLVPSGAAREARTIVKHQAYCVRSSRTEIARPRR
jgi:mannose-6-phosphate isomerase-like protein (cupin superfamily)